MADKRYFVDVFEEVVDNVRAIYDTVNDPKEAPYFLKGRPLEIIQLLQEKDESDEYKWKKYPLIVLFTNFTEKRGRAKSLQFEVSPKVAIITESDQDFRTGDRYTNSVKPVLYPIYELLLEEIANNPNFLQSQKRNIIHDITIWDGNPTSQSAGLSYSDYVDGIDIQFTDLKIFSQIICP
jgi:hypothetical protein